MQQAKIEKVLHFEHFDAFWCVACTRVVQGAQHVVVGSRSGRICYKRGCLGDAPSQNTPKMVRFGANGASRWNFEEASMSGLDRILSCSQNP